MSRVLNELDDLEALIGPLIDRACVETLPIDEAKRLDELVLRRRALIRLKDDSDYVQYLATIEGQKIAEQRLQERRQRREEEQYRKRAEKLRKQIAKENRVASAQPALVEPKAAVDHVRWRDFKKRDDIDVPKDLPLCEVDEVPNTPTHIIHREMDARARAMMAWAPWARRQRHSSRRYEGYSRQ